LHLLPLARSRSRSLAGHPDDFVITERATLAMLGRQTCADDRHA
jgi:hypothetical protein